jgi:hypothetical protein
MDPELLGGSRGIHAGDFSDDPYGTSSVAAASKPPSPPNPTKSSVPRLAFRREEAAAALGLSPRSFDQHIRPELRVIRRGRLVLYPIAEVERWLERNSARALEGDY